MKIENGISIPEEAHIVLETLNQAGYEAYLVGGWVRDCILHRSGQDTDITTNAQPDETLRLFKAYPRSEIGKNHGTIGVKIGSKWIEITTYRIDREIHDNRHPKFVEFTQQLKADVLRRDFTINALAMDKEGNLIDLVGGLDDLKNGIIRAVGDPHLRFEEDALRILRGLRLAAKLGFTLESDTLKAMHTHADLLKTLARERIWNEWNQWLHTSHPGSVLSQSRTIVKVYFPEITGVPEAWLADLDRLHPPILRWMALFHHLDRKTTEARLFAWKVPNQLTRDLIRRLSLVHETFPSERIPMKQVMRDAAPDALADAMKFQKHFKLPEYNPQADQMLQVLVHENACVKVAQLDLRGHDLLKLGFTGKGVQEALDALLDAVIREEVPNRKAELLNYANTRLT